MLVKNNIVNFSIMSLCSPTDNYKSFGRIYCLLIARRCRRKRGSLHIEMKFWLEGISSSTKWQQHSQFQQRYLTLNIETSLEDGSCRALAMDSHMPYVEVKTPNLLKKGPLPEDVPHYFYSKTN